MPLGTTNRQSTLLYGLSKQRFLQCRAAEAATGTNLPDSAPTVIRRHADRQRQETADGMAKGAGGAADLGKRGLGMTRQQHGGVTVELVQASIADQPDVHAVVQAIDAEVRSFARSGAMPGSNDRQDHRKNNRIGG